MKTITTEELAARLDSDEAIRLIDVLSREHYEIVHLPGAENIPLDELERRAAEKSARDETIVVYCASTSCQKSPQAAQLLERLGYADVHDYEGGIAEWRRDGREVIRGETETRPAAA